MQSQLTISLKLKEKIKDDPDLEKALYYAYNKKMDYGPDVYELPVSDNESFISIEQDGELSVINSFSSDYTDQNSEETVEYFGRKTRYVHAGTILKLKPQFDEPVHRMSSPLQTVRVLDFVFPVNSAIFSGEQQKSKGLEFKLFTNIYDFKRVTAVKYDNNEDVFSIDIEEKNFNKEFVYHVHSNEIMYYYDWLKSHGDKEGLEFFLKQKGFLDRFKKRIICTSDISSTNMMMQEKKISFEEKVKALSKPQVGKRYAKKIDDITMEWIKSMPYIIRRFKLVETEQYLSTELIEEVLSRNYLQLVGMSPENRDQVFSDLKKFSGLGFFCNAVTENWIYVNTDKDNDDYSKCGLQKPYKIFQPKSCCIKTLDTEETLEGHFVVWIQEYAENGQKYMENHMVQIVDKKIRWF